MRSENFEAKVHRAVVARVRAAGAVVAGARGGRDVIVGAGVIGALFV